jgi:predicted RNA binding protein YcfA (HicA-like mRNA interferase family)
VPPIRPISLRELIYYLRQCGFDGPYPGGKHQVMRKSPFKVTIPNKHQGDLSVPFVLKLLKQAGISREEWEAL